MAYIVGLTATDGCLYTGVRKINFKSNDRDLVELYLRILGRSNRIREQKTRAGNIAYFTEFADTRLYGWFSDVGLTPRKSLTLGAIDVPDQHLMSLARGLFDGDGTIQNFTHHPTPNTQPDYIYERLWVYFTSASRPHLEWLMSRINAALGVVGYLDVQRQDGKRDFYRLKYGKHASIALLGAMYPSDEVPRLVRKWAIWDRYRRKNLDCAEGGI